MSYKQILSQYDFSQAITSQKLSLNVNFNGIFWNIFCLYRKMIMLFSFLISEYIKRFKEEQYNTRTSNNFEHLRIKMSSWMHQNIGNLYLRTILNNKLAMHYYCASTWELEKSSIQTECWNLLHEFMEPIQSSLLFEFVICTTARNVKERDIPIEKRTGRY